MFVLDIFQKLILGSGFRAKKVELQTQSFVAFSLRQVLHIKLAKLSKHKDTIYSPF